MRLLLELDAFRTSPGKLGSLSLLDTLQPLLANAAFWTSLAGFAYLWWVILWRRGIPESIYDFRGSLNPTCALDVNGM